MNAPSHTLDTFGGLKIRQDRHGYRFSIDAALLGGLVRLGRNDRVADLGAGCGIVALCLAQRHRQCRFWAVEIQPELAAHADYNAQLNDVADRVRVFCQDLRTVTPDDFGGLMDWVVANPPYRAALSGRVNPQPQRAVARHEITVTLHDVVQAAARLLGRGGRFALIYPAQRLAEVIACLNQYRFAPKCLRPIHSSTGTPAKLVWLVARRDGRNGLELQPPLVIYRRPGVYSAEVKRLLKV